jgi:lysophospholipid acyltransferase (LPLAT)-like uncharacterized protein
LLAYTFIRTLAATLRYEFHYPPALLAQAPRPAIFCVWHNRLALCLLIYRDYARRCGQPPRMAAVVSASRDGALLARILELFGVQPVRGSSSRRGPQALLELTTWGERGYDLAITPDGPRGPCGRVQEGAVALAQLTGLPLIAASYTLGWKIRVKSWDRFLVPLPFSRVRVFAAEPLVVPRNVTDQERELLRQRLESLLHSLAPD